MRTIASFVFLAVALIGGPALAAPGDARLEKQIETRLPVPAAITDIEQAIDGGLIERRWTIEEKTPGRTVASILVRDKHFAQIAITYDTRSYVINLLRTEHLDQSDRRGVIHPAYIRWTRNLITSINGRVVRAAGPPPSVYAPAPVAPPQPAPPMAAEPQAAPVPAPAPEPASQPPG